MERCVSGNIGELFLIRTGVALVQLFAIPHSAVVADWNPKSTWVVLLAASFSISDCSLCVSIVFVKVNVFAGGYWYVPQSINCTLAPFHDYYPIVPYFDTNSSLAKNYSALRVTELHC